MHEKEISEQKKKIIRTVYESGLEAHLSSALSIMEILNVLFKDIMYIEDRDLESARSDRLVLSKGHASLALYVLYAELGYIEEKELGTYKRMNSRLGVHPDRHKVPGVDISTGSLGHGLPNAIGMAYAWKNKGRKNKIFVIVGDGELNEGSNWEAILFAAKMKLDNIVCIIDDNHSADNIPKISEKMEAFGWAGVDVDGHDTEALQRVLLEKRKNPFAVVAHTKKGNGIRMMEENHAAWHHKAITKTEYDVIMEELQ